MNKDSKSLRTTIYLAPSVHAALHASAKRHKRSFNSEVAWALEQYLAQQEQPHGDSKDL
jgi:predicted HicB family RNase H-like nuclease